MQDVEIIARIVLSAVFITSALAKMRPSPKLEQAVRQFSLGLAGPRLARFIARALPLFELMLGLAIAIGIWLKIAAALAALTLLIFTASMALNLRQGNRFRCNCFGSASSEIGVGSVTRNILLIMGSLFLVATASWTVSLIEPLHADIAILSNSSMVALLTAGTSIFAVLLVLDMLINSFRSITVR